MLMLHSLSSAIEHSEKRAMENILPLDSTLANLYVDGVLPVFIFCVFYVENLADSQ